MSNSTKFPIKYLVGENEVILDFSVEQQEFSWECGELGGVGFDSLAAAENDAIFWVNHGQAYLYTEQVSKGC